MHTPDAVRKAIANADTAALTRVPGIGKKGAERLVLELRDRIGPVPVGADGAAGVTARRLAGAGPPGAWSGSAGRPAQADQAVAAVAETVDGETPPVPVLLKQAIRLLGRTR